MTFKLVKYIIYDELLINQLSERSEKMKKCIVVYNPYSGKPVKKDFKEKIKKVLEKNNYCSKFIDTEYIGHAKKIVEEEKADLIVSIGGDGTFSEVMSGNNNRKEKLLLTHMPLGTTNDVGTMYGYGKDIVKNLEMSMDGNIKEIDLCTINNTPFTYVAGFGKFLNVPYETSREKKKKLGHIAYILEGVKEFGKNTKTYDITYEINGKTIRDKFSFMIASNSNRIAGINHFYKNIKLDDGKFEVLFCKLTKKTDILKGLLTILNGDITKANGFIFYRTDNLKLKFNEPLDKNWCIDGEKLPNITNEYEIKSKTKTKILIPNKNIKSLFTN